MNRVHVLMAGQEEEKRETLYYDSQDAREQMQRARGQFKYLSNLVAAQEAAATRKRRAAAAAAEARRHAAGASAAHRLTAGETTQDSEAAHVQPPSAAHVPPEGGAEAWEEVMMVLSLSHSLTLSLSPSAPPPNPLISITSIEVIRHFLAGILFCLFDVWAHYHVTPSHKFLT